MSQYTNLDSAETMFFQRELEQVTAKSYDVLKVPLKAFELIPVDSRTFTAYNLGYRDTAATVFTLIEPRTVDGTYLR